MRWSASWRAGGRDHAGHTLAPGTRAVIEPVLGYTPRRIHPVCPYCAEGQTGLCGNVAFGSLEPGLQTGFCADTGGGWSTAPLCAGTPPSSAPFPESFSDNDAVMVEPTACAVHAVLSAGVSGGDVVAVIGAGTWACAVTAALHHLVRPATPCTVTVSTNTPTNDRGPSRWGRTPWSPPISWPGPYGASPDRWFWPDA